MEDINEGRNRIRKTGEAMVPNEADRRRELTVYSNKDRCQNRSGGEERPDLMYAYVLHGEMRSMQKRLKEMGTGREAGRGDVREDRLEPGLILDGI